MLDEGCFNTYSYQGNARCSGGCSRSFQEEEIRSGTLNKTSLLYFSVDLAETDDQQDQGSSQMVEDSSTMHRKLRSKTNILGRDELIDKESERRLPIASAVPETTGEDTCVVCILLPDGRRVKRAFYKSDKVEVSYQLFICVNFCSESLWILQWKVS